EQGPWGHFTVHGLGVGDIDGDGRADFLTPYGWWKQPAPPSNALWEYHPFAFGRPGATQDQPGGAEIGVFDANGAGLNDVVTSLEGHGFGFAWYEQVRDAKGAISFVQHMIMDHFEDANAGGVTFTQPHAIAFADMNGDGLTDVIIGKRPMSHLSIWADP